MAESFVYLDHAATTPLRPEALEAMLPYLTASWANPSSPYEAAYQARTALEAAREAVAACLGASPPEIVFTGGGSEADNLAIKGAALAASGHGRHIVTSSIEHHAVLHACQYLERRLGFEVTYLPVDRYGLISLASVRAALRNDTVVVSLMQANNEVGTIEPIAEIAAVVRNHGALVHTDAVQVAGALPIGVYELGVDLLSISGHKFGGPKGTGALYVRRGTPLDALVHGGGQELGLRAGTENVAGAVGFATALELAVAQLSTTSAYCRTLRDRLIAGVLGQIPGSILTGDPERRLPNNASFCFPEVEGESVLIELDAAGICASAGSACSAGSTEPSHVLVAMGIEPRYLRGALRLTVGPENTPDEIELVVARLKDIVGSLRTLAA